MRCVFINSACAVFLSTLYALCFYQLCMHCVFINSVCSVFLSTLYALCFYQLCMRCVFYQLCMRCVFYQLCMRCDYIAWNSLFWNCLSAKLNYLFKFFSLLIMGLRENDSWKKEKKILWHSLKLCVMNRGLIPLLSFLISGTIIQFAYLVKSIWFLILTVIKIVLRHS